MGKKICNCRADAGPADDHDVESFDAHAMLRARCSEVGTLLAASLGYDPVVSNDAEPPMTIRPRRSVLYMPGSNARALEKARTLPVDGVILDLEDSVAPGAKDAARQQVIDAVKAGGFGPREVF